MAGRRPTPTALRLVKGNPGKRAINKKEPKPRRQIPRCPAHLDPSGKRAWKNLVKLLDGMTVLTEADGLALARICDCYTDILECRKLIKRDGRTYKTFDQNGNELIKNNPAVSQLRAADAQLKSYLVEFGLTPAARTKLKVDDGEEEGDDASRFFG